MEKSISVTEDMRSDNTKDSLHCLSHATQVSDEFLIRNNPRKMKENEDNRHEHGTEQEREGMIYLIWFIYKHFIVIMIINIFRGVPSVV